MASPANNKSSSSPPIPNRPNPKPRNSEAGDPMRRSFGGNPFQANSRVNIPSDLSRRNSCGGRDNSRVDYSDKENETKALLTPKGSKNFMSPTISAVSKINASPRKKVLSESNQMSRSTVSLSDVKGLILEEEEEAKSLHHARSCVSLSDAIDIDVTKQFEGSHDMTVTDFDEFEVHENTGITYSDPRFRISPRPSVPYTSPEFAACEVGPLWPPYDPKKNYLSPRPEFLHYKPNPRIEQHFDECKQLEELFISESSPDTELSVEDAYLDGGVEETEDVESDEEMVCESTEETSRVPKQSGFKKFRFLGWLLALALGYMLVSATVSPQSLFYEFHITEYAKAENLEQLSERVRTLTESSLVYMDQLLSRLGGEEQYGPLQFHNLTYVLGDDTVFQPTSVKMNEESFQEKGRGENNLEDGFDEELEEESGGEENSEVMGETEDEQAEMKPGTGIELNEGEGNLEARFEDGLELDHEGDRDSKSNAEENNDTVGHTSQEKLQTGSTKKEPETMYINQHDAVSEAIKEHQQKESEVDDGESGSEEEDLGETAAETSDDHHRRKTDLANAMILLSSTVVLLVAFAFLFAKKVKPVAASAAQPAFKTQDLNLSHVPVEKEGHPLEDVDDRISSSSYHKKSELRSGGGKMWRESMASSASEYSVGSFSYGSFTTYEKIPIKTGDREQEIITPVRRSSRIRNNQPCASGL